MKTNLLIALFLFVSQASWARFENVPDQQVLHEIQAAPQTTPLAGALRLLTWNIHKAKANQAWMVDMQNLSADKNFVLVQEAIENPTMLQAVQSLPQLGWLMARSFFMETDHQGTGVMTGSSQNPWSSLFLRSRDTEPVINTPKMSLWTTYQLASGERLLVVNVHGINFTSQAPFERQVQDIAALVRDWQGKAIVAGDFNTWSSGRTDFLLNTMQGLGMQHLTFAQDSRQMKLDHIFVRGCTVQDAQLHSEIDSSDHFPLSAEVLCDH